MTTDQMDEDLAACKSFDALSERVNYWRRRLSNTAGRDTITEDFDAVVAKHSQRVLGVLRAG
jgi:hypothetical protein